MSSSQESRNQRILESLSNAKENNKCFECGRIGTNYVVSDFSVFVCQSCAGIHREFGHRVKSVTMSKFTSEEVGQLKDKGNKYAQKYWLKNWSPKEYNLPTSGSSTHVREYIEKKYKNKTWVGSVNEPTGSPQIHALSSSSPSQKIRISPMPTSTSRHNRMSLSSSSLKQQQVNLMDLVEPTTNTNESNTLEHKEQPNTTNLVEEKPIQKGKYDILSEIQSEQFAQKSQMFSQQQFAQSPQQESVFDFIDSNPTATIPFPQKTIYPLSTTATFDSFHDTQNNNSHPQQTIHIPVVSTQSHSQQQNDRTCTMSLDSTQTNTNVQHSTFDFSQQFNQSSKPLSSSNKTPVSSFSPPNQFAKSTISFNFNETSFQQNTSSSGSTAAHSQHKTEEFDFSSGIATPQRAPLSKTRSDVQFTFGDSYIKKNETESVKKQVNEDTNPTDTQFDFTNNQTHEITTPPQIQTIKENNLQPKQLFDFGASEMKKEIKNDFIFDEPKEEKKGLNTTPPLVEQITTENKQQVEHQKKEVSYNDLYDITQEIDHPHNNKPLPHSDSGLLEVDFPQEESESGSADLMNISSHQTDAHSGGSGSIDLLEVDSNLGGSQTFNFDEESTFKKKESNKPVNDPFDFNDSKPQLNKSPVQQNSSQFVFDNPNSNNDDVDDKNDVVENPFVFGENPFGTSEVPNPFSNEDVENPFATQEDVENPFTTQEVDNPFNF